MIVKERSKEENEKKRNKEKKETTSSSKLILLFFSSLFSSKERERSLAREKRIESKSKLINHRNERKEKRIFDRNMADQTLFVRLKFSLRRTLS